MTFMNIEIKARCFDPKKVKGVLEEHNAEFKGVDHRIDTYFQVASGRMKLREGKIFLERRPRLLIRCHSGERSDSRIM